MGNDDDSVESLLPYGQCMAKADQFVIEVHYAPLPANELEERRVRLRTLLLRGAMRSVEQHTNCSEAQAHDLFPVGSVEK